jgi:hypothetical protein
MNTIEIKGKEFTEDDIIKVLEMANDILEVNSELNARCIAFSAKLENEENKVKQLSHTLQLLISNQKIYNA